MSDKDLAQQALDALTKTTVAYPTFQQNVKNKKYKPTDGSTTNWGIALSNLEQIANPALVVVTPPVVNATNFSGMIGSSVGYQLPYMSATDRNKVLDLMVQGKQKIVRFDVDWGNCEPSKGNYNWANRDALVSAIVQRGMIPLGCVAYTPSWARPAGTTDKCPPTNMQDYANFAVAAAKHFVPLGMSIFECWNEQNSFNFWSTGPNPTQYASMLKLMYTSVKETNLNTTIVYGGCAPVAPWPNQNNSAKFLQACYTAWGGGPGPFDALGHHPYTWPWASGMTQLDWDAWGIMYVDNINNNGSLSLRTLMTQNHDGAKQIWATEIGWPTGGSGIYAGPDMVQINPYVDGGGGGANRAVSESTQASRFVNSIKLWRSFSWAGPYLMYMPYDTSATDTTTEGYFGLANSSMVPKAALAAVAAIA